MPDLGELGLIVSEAYQPRLVDSQLKQYLRTFGAVEIVGCRWCGKTWTAIAHGNSVIRLDDPQIRSLIEADNNLAFEGERPHVIDEWQVVPSLWDATRRKVDDAGSQKGLFILTGSSTPHKNEVMHSGAGRIARIRMRPMSLAETSASDKSVSLAGLFEGEFNKGPVQTDLKYLAHLICRGGWPGALHLEHEDDTGLLPLQYLDSLLSNDIRRKGLNENTMQRLLSSLARTIGSAATVQTLGNDIIDGDVDVENGSKNNLSETNGVLSRSITAKYLEFLQEQFLIEDLVGWDAPVKSRSRVRSKPKRTFVDPSLPAVLLGFNASRLMMEMQVFGQLFEELCLRDLRVYTSTMEGIWSNPVRYYRDSDGLEVDAIIELVDGRWAAFEIKLSQNKVDDGVKNLLRLRDKVRANPAAHNQEPAFLAVIVGKADFKYQTPEGVYVVPITSLTA